MSRLVTALLAIVFLLAWSSTAWAYPWMIRHGFTTCSNCHDDPSGGELLTEFGRGQGYTRLAMAYGQQREKRSEPLWGMLDTPDWGRFGASYRHLAILEFDDDVEGATFPMQADLYAAVRVGSVRAGGPPWLLLPKRRWRPATLEPARP